MADEEHHPLNAEWGAPVKLNAAGEVLEGGDFLYGTGIVVGHGTVMDETGMGDAIVMVVEALVPEEVQSEHGKVMSVAFAFKTDFVNVMMDALQRLKDS